MTGGSASRSAGILSRANELERLNTQIEDIRGRLGEPGHWRKPAGSTTAAAYEMETAQAQRRELEDSILKLEERFQGYQSPMPSWTPSRPDFGRSWRRSRPDPARPRPIPGTPAPGSRRWRARRRPCGRG
ncbi:MAG: hypothetical protein ACLSAF_02430 [Intestinimonas sp.]